MYILCTGSHTPIRCPSGTWSNSTGLWDELNCTDCPAGWYCQQTGLTDPEDPCLQGYYCPTGKIYRIIISTLYNLNFYPLEVVSRYHDPQLQVVDN